MAQVRGLGHRIPQRGGAHGGPAQKTWVTERACAGDRPLDARDAPGVALDEAPDAHDEVDPKRVHLVSAAREGSETSRDRPKLGDVSDLRRDRGRLEQHLARLARIGFSDRIGSANKDLGPRSEEHTSELQSRENLVCRLLLEKKKKKKRKTNKQTKKNIQTTSHD